MEQTRQVRLKDDMLRDPFNRALLCWLINGPRSFADVVAAFGLKPSFVRAHLRALIAAGFVRASAAEPLDRARRLSVVRRALRAAGMRDPIRIRPDASPTRTLYSHVLMISDATGYGAITGDDV
jgi:DNA-binding transcriptional ArsR family regulator